MAVIQVVRRDVVMWSDVVKLAPAWIGVFLSKIYEWINGAWAVLDGWTMADILTFVTIVYTLVLLVLKVWEAYQKCVARRKLVLRRRVSDIAGPAPRGTGGGGAPGAPVDNETPRL